MTDPIERLRKASAKLEETRNVHGVDITTVCLIGKGKTWRKECAENGIPIHPNTRRKCLI